MGLILELVEVVLVVDDLERSLAFYHDLLGLEVFSPPHLPASFLRIADGSAGIPQQIVLVPGPKRAGQGPDVAPLGPRRLHHIGLAVAPDAFEPLRARLQQAGYTLRGGEHPFLPVDAVYLDDPDGNEVEIVTRRG